MSDFLKNVVKEVGNEYASIVADGVEAGDVSTFIDTGSHILNGLLSGSLYGARSFVKRFVRTCFIARARTLYLILVRRY